MEYFCHATPCWNGPLGPSSSAFGQNGGKKTIMFAYTSEEIWQILQDDRQELMSCKDLTENLCMCTYKLRSEYDTTYRRGSLKVAIYTISQARLQLYE
ncbi:hypothetical protein QR680_007407 [Steinernema hermaphroditum]|uniref:Uncharacterized protein n=1 Tax=Steinernema hermaphroditum TaxID=289476 RepID=A0AA39ID29_9BILA|nr:hypothetical protein QR680_007407 [Steinernema hermaphroditum]